MRPRADASVLEPSRKRGTRYCLSKTRARLRVGELGRALVSAPGRAAHRIRPQDEYCTIYRLTPMSTGKAKGMKSDAHRDLISSDSARVWNGGTEATV